jgi:lipopolysaccharide transport system permease protein
LIAHFESHRQSNLMSIDLCEREADVAPSSDQSGVAAPQYSVTIIEARRGLDLAGLHELWRYRELLYFLAWRDVKVRYKQTILGAAWTILQPLATMVVFTIFFGRVANVSVGDFPYSLFVLSGLLPWFFFANSVSSAGQSIVGNQNLITKVYFPRLHIPMSAVAAGLVDFTISCALLAVMMVAYGIISGLPLLLAPVVVVALIFAALGVGTLLSALTVAYRDFRVIVPFMVQLWMFATPSIYLDPQALSPTARAFLPLNPAYGLIANFRAAVLGTQVDLYALSVSTAVSVVLFAVGCLYFRRVERSFADII